MTPNTETPPRSQFLTQDVAQRSKDIDPQINVTFIRVSVCDARVAIGNATAIIIPPLKVIRLSPKCARVLNASTSRALSLKNDPPAIAAGQTPGNKSISQSTAIKQQHKLKNTLSDRRRTRATRLTVRRPGVMFIWVIDQSIMHRFGGGEKVSG